jgi:hypothetical protein
LAAQDEIPGLGARTDRPRLNTAADLGQQKLSPTEGFVLSRVDGQSSYDDICKVSGLGREQTLEILRSLKQAKLILGPNERVVGGVRKPLRPATPQSGIAVEDPRSTQATPPQVERTSAEPVPPPSPAPSAPAPKEPEKPHAKTAPAPATSRGVGPLERLDDGSPVAENELKDWPEADPLLKERIIRLHRRMKKLSPFEFLGLPSKADAAALRRAFTIASKELHPDRYFGQKLGSFKNKLAAIFARLTEAMQEIEDGQKGKR